jgi:hypothetical protein
MAEKPGQHAAEWIRLYRCLIARHHIKGPPAFSERALSLQLEVPGCHYFRAVMEGEVQAALVCYLDRGIAFSHLASATMAGQQASLQYALYWSAIEAFRDRADWFSLGSTPGLVDTTPSSGLGFFKSGWATHVCRNYFCGRICDHDGYERLSRGLDPASSRYFPAYRYRAETSA